MADIKGWLKKKADEVKQAFSSPKKYLNATPIGQASNAVRNYFQPTENVRARDIVRELPGAFQKINRYIGKTAAQDAVRFGISAYEVPQNKRTGWQSTGKYYNTPFGRLNSFQSEAANRVNRGDPMWKAIGNPAADIILAGLDVGTIAKTGLGALKTLKGAGPVTSELRNFAGDLMQPTMKTVNVPAIKTRFYEPTENFAVGGKRQMRELPTPIEKRVTVKMRVPNDFKSKTMQSLSRPGLTLKDVSGVTPTNPKAISKTAREAQLLTGKGKNPTSNLGAPLGGDIPYTGTVPPTKNLASNVFDSMQGTTKERGFVTTVKESKKTPAKMKKLVEGTYTVKSDKKLTSDARRLIQENPAEAEKMALNPRNDTDVTVGNELINSLLASGKFAEAERIVSGMAESGTEFGRAVRAFGQYDKTTPEGALRFAQQTIKTYNKANPSKQLKLGEKQVKSLFEKAKAIQKMAEGRERNIASWQLMDEVNKLIPSTIADKGIAIWKAGLLTSPRTTLRNIFGNAVHQGAEMLKDLPATGADILMAGTTGKRTLTPTLKGTVTGAKKGWQSATDIMRTGYDPEQAITKFDFKRVNWGEGAVGKTLGKYTDFVFSFLGAQDKPFYQAAFSRSLYDQAGAAAINAGKKGNTKFIEGLVKKPTEQMLKTATQDASLATFKDKNVIAQAVGRFKNYVGGKSETAKVISEVLMPFTGVPTSIAGQMVQYSPIGLVKGTVKAGRVMSGKVPELQRLAAQEIGRGIVGTGLMGIGAYLVSQGLMTGNPKDATEANQWQLEGKQANSVLIGGKWRSINSIGPEALVMLAGAKAQEALTSDDNEGISGKLGATGSQIGKDFVSQTFLAGVQGPLNAINDPARYGGSYVGNQAASIVPNIVKDTSKAFDSNAREINSFTDPLKASIPGVRNTLVPKRDVLGNEVKQQPTGIKAYLDLFNSKTPINNTVVNELARLNLSGERATPSKIQKNQTILGEKVKLSPQDLDLLEKESGGVVQKALADLINSPEYSGLADEDKKKLISDTISDIRKSTKLSLASGQEVQSESGVLRFISEGKEVQLNIGKVLDMPETSNFERAEKEKEAWAIAGKLEDSDLPIERKADIYQQLGIDPPEAEYYQVAKKDNDLKGAYVADVLDQSTPETMMDDLSMLRKKVNGKNILADGVIDDLYDAGTITASQKKYLKSIDDIDLKTGTTKIKSSKPKKLRAAKKLSLPKINVPKPKKAARVKVKRAPKIKVPKRQKLRTLTSR